ncbi:S8 family serine peptidase [Planctobacterium marinum]|uniref:S8 family serine peptidase n=1 Tax=Planctobacterium marinum TaxID=1631968 RepID=UPI001E622337|nr:S8 family serine peptidase [Planctobacterium marinum]MCC2607068.1 S8 family serine peptidase [Planctobacterium marinum]
MSLKLNKILLGLGISSLSLIASSTLAQDLDAAKGPMKSAAEKSAIALNSAPDLAEMQQRYIVVFKDNAVIGSAESIKGGDGVSLFDREGKLDARLASDFLRGLGATPIKSIEGHKMMVVNMDKETFNTVSNHHSVATAEVDPKRYLQAQTTPYGIPMVQADQLFQNNLSARKVCVIDTGYNLGHPDLPDQNNGASGTANNGSVGNWYNDGNGHGTHVAGTIAALSNNEGVIGVYPGVDIHAVKIFNDSGNWTFASDLIAGIQQCADAGANVVNMSLGGGSSSTSESNAMQGFNDQGIMLVAAAGNDGNSTFSYPASYDAVISVAAVSSSENHASYSQYNSQVELAGPGSSVYSTYPTNTYATLSGTSMATPHVVGVAALVWSFFPQCSDDQIRSALQATSKDKGASGRDNYYGYGIVQSEDAYNYLNTYGCDGDGSGGGGGGGGDVDPVNGSLSDLSGARRAWDRYTWEIPAGVTTMTVSISGGTGDADLYMRFGAQPSTSTFDCRPYTAGNNETCTFNNPAAGTWHIGIRGYSAYSGVTLNYSYQ